MTLGKIATSILTDIANALRYKAGVATLYRPSRMAAAVLALDGTDAGNYQAQQYKELEYGLLSSAILEDIADAIRAQNESSDTYEPDEMAQAILDLTFTPVPRALLLDDGTMELCYRKNAKSALGTVEQAFVIDPAGYSSASSRPYYSVRAQVTKVVIDSSFANVGLTNGSYLFDSFSAMTEVEGFEYLSGMTSAAQMFSGCTKLETIYATSFDNTGLSASMMFYGCVRLVGGADGACPTNSSGASVCKLGSGGVLTDPSADARTWFWAHFYDDGGAVITASSTPDASRTLVASGRICATAKYNALGFTPWDSNTATNRSLLTSVAFASDMAGYAATGLRYMFYNCSNLAAVSGLSNLANVGDMEYAFSSCTSLVTLDFRGFDPSSLTDLFYTFAGCTALTTIYADSTWALPASGISGSQCFYRCTSLVGGAGTAWSSSNTGYAYMRIDTASTPGYLTAA